ncbi:Cupredoxin [Sporormia fimetaria CBS 119925]|uniref:Cupredoxin n=1 Tax=Sporormia fimetaria CBS 119925 TaxID=1340428 RepID=A0A6A6VMA1_9PLEO|nr:Cupredoxin [Sporormia fimetaria CBS 119925]
MRFSSILASTAITGAALAKDITVVAGKSGLTFEPAEIQAEEGDIVWFKFWPKNHSVAQSTFDKPCQPAPNGFWSGYVPQSEAKASDTTFAIEVTNASAPIWFYCTQQQHCQNGMVGVINAPANNEERTLETFKEGAAEEEENVEPTSEAGTGGQLGAAQQSGSPSGSPSGYPSGTPSGGAAPESTGAASPLQVNSLAISGVMGLLAYFAL